MVSRYSLLSALKTHFVNNALFIIVVLIARSLFFILGLLYLLNNVLYIIAWDSQLLILAIITQRVNNAKYLLWWYWKVSQGLAFQNRDLGTITNLISFVNKLITQWIINAPVFFLSPSGVYALASVLVPIRTAIYRSLHSTLLFQWYIIELKSY